MNNTCYTKQHSLDLGEEIGDNAIEQLEIILQEFRYINIPDSTETDQLFRSIRLVSLEVSSSRDNGFHSSHTKIVVILGGINVVDGYRK